MTCCNHTSAIWQFCAPRLALAGRILWSRCRARWADSFHHREVRRVVAVLSSLAQPAFRILLPTTASGLADQGNSAGSGSFPVKQPHMGRIVGFKRIGFQAISPRGVKKTHGPSGHPVRFSAFRRPVQVRSSNSWVNPIFYRARRASALKCQWRVSPHG
jgi:hypothetical protein